MSPELLYLYNRAPYKLIEDAPVLSSNLKNHIRLINVSDDELVFMIEAPQYNVNQFTKTGKISYTGKQPDYAIWLNNLGAFATHNKSEHWVNRSLFELCFELKRAVGGRAEVENTLELDYGVGYMNRSKTKYSSKFKREVKIKQPRKTNVSERVRFWINRIADERMH